MGSLAKRLLLSAALLALVLTATEVALRLLGYTPLHPWPMQPNPAQSTTFIQPDSLLGFALNPSRHRITYYNGYTFTATHNPDGTRICETAGSSPDSLPLLLLTGCSFAYGQGLPDSQTLGYYLQQALRGQYRIINAAVPGYGTVQQYLLLKKRVEEGNAPKTVVVTYASFHNERNVLARSYRKGIAAAMQGPFAHLQWPIVTPQGAIQHTALTYPCLWLLRHSALANLLDDIYNQKTAAPATPAPSLTVIDSLQVLCKTNNIQLFVYGIDNTHATTQFLQLCRTKGIVTAQTTLDVFAPENNLLPQDMHPSAATQKSYAGDVVSMLKSN